MSKSDSTKAVGRFFGGYAAEFDAIYGHTARRGFLGRWIDCTFRRVMLRRFEETLRRTAKPDIRSVLDVGCGPGRYLVAFARQGKQVVGVDVADGMLDLARAHIESAGVAEHIALVSGDYLAMRFDRTFDAACLMGFFDYVTDPAPVLRKLAAEVTEEIYASFPKAGGVLAWQRRVRYRLRGCPLWLYRRQEVEAALGTSGFEGRYEIQDFGRDWYVVVRVKR